MQGASDEVVVHNDEAATLCCCLPFFRRRSSELHEPLTAGADDPAAAPPGPELLSPRSRQLGKVVEEVVLTERTYVADLELLATHFMPLLRTQIAASGVSDLPDCGSLVHMHREVLARLAEAGESVAGLAQAFGGMAPYLRLYATYCSAYDMALLAADELRSLALQLRTLPETHGQSAPIHLGE